MNDNYPDGPLVEILGTVVGDQLVAHEALAHYGSLRRLERASETDRRTVCGIGPARARRLRAAFALSRHLAEEQIRGRAVIERPADVHRLLGPSLIPEEREVFVVVGLDARNRVRLVHRAAVGSLTRCALTPRDVFTPIVREAVAHVILCHNHPSGDPTPSPQDITLTRRMKDAGKLLGIAVLDHVIVAAEGYASVMAGDP